MSFPQSRVSDENQCFAFGDVFSTRQVQDVSLIEAGQRREIKVRQFFEDREMSSFHPALNAVLFAGVDFLFDQR